MARSASDLPFRLTMPYSVTIGLVGLMHWR
jgi:hypothetical protein